MLHPGGQEHETVGRAQQGKHGDQEPDETSVYVHLHAQLRSLGMDQAGRRDQQHLRPVCKGLCSRQRHALGAIQHTAVKRIDQIGAAALACGLFGRRTHAALPSSSR